jgi:invasion protein IalB
LTIVPAKTGPVLVVTAPYDVLLTSGLGLVFGTGKPRVYPFQTCNLVGCVAEIALTPGLREAMLQAKDGKLLFGSLNQKVVAISFSLQDFRRAEKALFASQKKRNFLGVAI